MCKKFLAIFVVLLILSLQTLPTFANNCGSCSKIEHLDVHPKAPCNEVVIKQLERIVKEGNVLEFSFNDMFHSKCHKAGDIVYFDTPQALYTCEGSLILPACTKIIAEITNIEKPKIFNKNARVSLIFRKILLPDNSCIEIKARPFTKDCKLTEGPWVTTGKVLLSTIGLGAIGAGTGVGFAFIPNPAKIGTGLAIGIPVGAGIGLLTGLITPGVHYKAKKGETIYAVLLEKFCIYECKK